METLALIGFLFVATAATERQACIDRMTLIDPRIDAQVYCAVNQNQPMEDKPYEDDTNDYGGHRSAGDSEPGKSKRIAPKL